MYQGSSQHISNYLKAADLGRVAQQKQLEERVALYYQNPKRCLHCEGPIAYEKKRTNRFCQKSCSAAFNNRARGAHSEQTRAKISLATRKAISDSERTSFRSATLVQRTCGYCKKEFEVKMAKKRQMFCSVACIQAHRRTNEEALEAARAKGRSNVQKQMSEGRWKGWSGQSLGVRSFPEKYVEELLVEAGQTDYVFQHQVGRFSLDFAFPALHLVLEVDGKQHLRPAGKAHDARRDAWLAQQGWRVVRLPWVSVRTQAGRQRIQDHLDAFLDVLKQARASRPLL